MPSRPCKYPLGLFRLRGCGLRTRRRLRSRLRVGLRLCRRGRRCGSVCGRRGWRSCRGRRLWHGFGNLFEDRAALPNGLIGAQYQGHRAQHEHDGAPRCGFRENVSRTTRTEGRLAARAAEGAGEVRGLAALEQYDNDQHQTIQNEKAREEPSGEPEAKHNDSDADEQRYSPLDRSFCLHTYLLSRNQKSRAVRERYVKFTSEANDLGSRLAPPTSAPSNSSCAINP